MKTLFFYIAAICLSAACIASGKLAAQPFSIKLYNVNDGLPSTSVYQAIQDSYGYLWITTPAGLSRFDGRQFVNYTLADGLPSLQVTAVFQDSQNRLWIGTGAGMAQFKDNSFITYPATDKLANFYVFGFTEINNGKIWANTGAGVYEFIDSAWKKILLFRGYENKMSRKTIESRGELYINYPYDIVCKTKEGKWLTVASMQQEGLFNKMSVWNNEIWVNTSENIYRIHNHQLVSLFKKKLGAGYYFSYLLDSKNRLWLAGTDFIKVSESGIWEHFTNVSTRQYGFAYGINEDASHNIWIGTDKGLLKIKDNEYSAIDSNHATLFDGIYNIIALPDTSLILSSGTQTGWLHYQKGQFKSVNPPSASDKNFYKDPVDAYTFDEKNSAWMITRFRKLLHFNSDNKIEDFSGLFHFKTTEIVYDIDYDKQRHCFFICADSTLLYGHSSNLITFVPRNTGVPITKPVRVHVLKNGLLLVFVAEKGLYCIDQSNNLTALPIKDFNNNYTALKISSCLFCEEHDNNFWLAIPGFGLYEYGFTKDKLPVLKNHFSNKDGLQNTYILSLTADKQNRLWIATQSGIDILQKNNTGNWQIFNYATMDEFGLAGSFYEKLVTDNTGTVWLSSPNKVLKFNAASIHLSKEPPHIVIEKVSLLFKETNWNALADSLYAYYQLPYNPVLKYYQNSLGISYNAIDLSITNAAPDYSYRLLPVDTNWSIPSKNKSVSFAQLPAGKYQFIVRAKDMASGWSAPAVFVFTITPPFWEEWWFRLIVVVIASIIIISIFQARIKKIRQAAFIQNQLKELEMKALKAQMNPHFIYNALNSIQALVANDKKQEGIHYIGSFSKLLRQVLDNSENNVISLDKELETINLYIQLESLRLNMQLQYRRDIPKEVVTEFEKIPPLILQPFIENALWHGLSHKEGGKEIKITVRLMENWLLCDVIDNGIGRTKAQEIKSHSLNLHQSKGIDITRKRLLDFNEDCLVAPVEFIDLYDHQNQACGTRVTVRIKRKKTL